MDRTRKLWLWPKYLCFGRTTVMMRRGGHIFSNCIVDTQHGGGVGDRVSKNNWGGG